MVILMNELQLSKRLELVTKEIIKGARVADIGSDHAYLPCYAVLEGIASFAIAGEVVEGPFQSAIQQVQKCQLEEKISVRKGNGLAVIEPGEVDVITICGMGGPLIRDILGNGKEKLEGVTRLVLQPNIAAHNIRKWFLDNDWELKKEMIIKEGDKIYEILVGEKGDPKKPYKEESDAELYLGPLLLEEKNEVFIEKWTREYETLRKIKAQIDQVEETEENLSRKKEIAQKMCLIEGALK